MRWFALIACFFLFGCTATAGVVASGHNVFKVSRQVSTGSSAATTLKADALRDARTYCLEHGKTLKVIHTSETRPAYLFGAFQRADIRFTCVDTAGQ
ncbi:MAG TPA: hypothetical protein VJ955_00690 [Desulfuromonadales bacterium]|nr:hypothetical protein [Desulfuromonadales bacterium]